MAMWRVTVSPEENPRAWQTYVEQGIIAIGWPDHSCDNEPPVLRFKSIAIGDWIVAHVPESHGGGKCKALAVGCVIGGYMEITRNDLPPDDEWNGAFRRQFSVEWSYQDELSLREITGYYRGTVHRLTPAQASSVLAACELLA